jgi:hypothetical protein
VCLALKDCYLDEKTFEFINEFMNELKTLSLIQCYVQSMIQMSEKQKQLKYLNIFSSNFEIIKDIEIQFI